MPTLRPLRVVPIALAAAVALVAGCGESGASGGGGEASAAAGTPTGQRAAAATTPSPGEYAGTGELSSRDGASRKGKLTLKPFARYHGRVAITRAAGGQIAVAVGGENGLELRLSTDGALPRKAEGASEIPTWANIHFGTDAAGAAVITYPRCETATIGSCDLVAWNPATKAEGPVEGAADPRRAETEGVLDRGNVLFTVDRDGKVDHETMRLENRGAPTQLVLRRRGQAERTLTRKGGRRLVFAGGALGELGGTCGNRPRLLNPAGKETFYDAFSCGFNEGVDGVGSSIVDGHFSFALAKTEASMMVVDHRIGSGLRRAREASIGTDAQDWIATSTTSGIALTGFGCDGLYEDAGGTEKPSCVVTSITGLTYRPRR